MIIIAEWNPYTHFPRKKGRPPCDSCGPWADARMRRLSTGEWRCQGCDEED